MAYPNLLLYMPIWYMNLIFFHINLLMLIINNVHHINMLKDHIQYNPATIPFIPYVHFYLKKHASYRQVWNFHRRLNMKTVISSQRMVPALLSGKATF